MIQCQDAQSEAESRAESLESKLSSLASDQVDGKSYMKQYEDCKWELIEGQTKITDLQRSSSATEEKLKEDLRLCRDAQAANQQNVTPLWVFVGVGIIIGVLIGYFVCRALNASPPSVVSEEGFVIIKKVSDGKSQSL